MNFSLLDLPSLVTHHLFYFLDYESLKAVRQVCKTWHLFLEQNDSLFKKFVKIESATLKSNDPRKVWDRKYLEETLQRWKSLAKNGNY